MNIAAIAIIIVILILLIAALVAVNLRIKKLKKGEQKRKTKAGSYGEDVVAKALDEAVQGEKYLLRDSIFDTATDERTGKRYTTEVDFIMVCNKGVLVVEAKNWGGEIYGTADSAQWTQCLKDGTKKPMYNPLLQNEAHVKVLNRIVPGNVLIKPFVVFVQNNAKGSGAQYVLSVQGLKEEIEAMPPAPKYNIKKVAKEIQNARSDVSRKDHIEYVQGIKDSE